MKPIGGAEYLKGTNEDCPACGTKLDLYSMLRIKFEGCPKCYGMWLEKDGLRKLKDKVGIGELHWLNCEIENIEQTAAIPGKRVCPKADGGKLLSVVFGKTSVVLDWCPKCHGVWLERGEYDKIIEYLRNEAGEATIKDVENEIAEDLRQLWKGRPAGRLAEIGELAAAVTALLNFTIFEHPKLFKFLTDAQAGGRSVGMD